VIHSALRREQCRIDRPMGAVEAAIVALLVFERARGVVPQLAVQLAQRRVPPVAPQVRGRHRIEHELVAEVAVPQLDESIVGEIAPRLQLAGVQQWRDGRARRQGRARADEIASVHAHG
jgi:hypothetical protein